MSFTSFLKGLGQGALRATAIVTGLPELFQRGGVPIGGPATKVLDRAVDTLVQVGAVVASAEIMLNSQPGPDRLKAAAPLTAQLLRASEVAAGHEIADDALFLQGATKITDGMADIQNSFRQKPTP